MGQSKTLYWKSLTSVALVAICSPAVASAQVNENPPGEEIQGDIVVTAQKRSESISKVGMSITAISGEDLARSGTIDTKDLVKDVPGFTVASSVTNTPIYTLRGMGFNTYNMSSTSPVGVYVDQTAYAYPYMTQQTAYDLERVEVLKGPQGTLYGRNTTGGLIKFVTAKPTRDFEGSMSFGYGSYQTLTAQGYLSGPLGDTLSARLAFNSEVSGKGWQQSVTRDERLGKKNRQAARLTLLWEPSSDFTATFRASAWRDRSDTQAAQLAYYVPEHPDVGVPASIINQSLLLNGKNHQADWTPADQPGPQQFSRARPAYEAHADFYSLALDLDYEFGSNFTINSSTAYNHVKRNDMQSADGVPFEFLSFQPYGNIGSFSQELRLSQDTGAFKWTIGGYYSHDDIIEGDVAWINDFSTITLLRAIGATIPHGYDPRQIAEGMRNNDLRASMTSTSASLFGNAQYEISDSLSATIGARYTSDRTKFAGCLHDYENNANPIWDVVVAQVLAGIPSPGATLTTNGCITFNADLSAIPVEETKDTLKQDNFSWRLGLDWEPAPNMLVYATVSRGYKSGGFPIIPANTVRQLAPVDQEEVTAYEIGSKFRVGPVRATMAAYFNNYKDKQVFGLIQDPIFTALERILNVPKSEIYGAEVSLDWTVGGGLSLNGAASYVHTEVKEYAGFDQFGNAVDFAGTEFPYSPKWQLSGGARLETSLTDRVGLRGSVSASYQSKSHSDFQDIFYYYIKPYTLVDATLSIHDADDSWEAGIWVKNLFDETYWTSANYSRDTFTRFAGMPRTAGVRFTFKF